MPKEKFTNNELAIMLKEITDHMYEIKRQTTETNGRLKKLELWKQFLLGAWAVLTVLTPIGWYVSIRIADNFQDQISYQITDAIEENNNKYFEKE